MCFRNQFYPDQYNTPAGCAIWRILNCPQIVRRMQELSDQGQPAVVVVDSDLLANHEQALAIREALQEDQFSRMTGEMISQIMSNAGYVIHEDKHPIDSEFFQTGTIYRRQ